MGTGVQGVAPMPTIVPGMDFQEASASVVDYLKVVMPLGFWAVTRFDDTDQLYLEVRDDAYGLAPGDGCPWSDSFCQHMVRGTAPQIAPDAMADPVYAAAAEGVDIPVGAYVGLPILLADGSLFGTLCGIDPDPQSATMADQAPLLALLVGLLSSILEADLARVRLAREVERVHAESETDLLTGLLNRRGWEARLSREEHRYARFGDPAAVLVIDLDRLKAVNDAQGHEAGDRYIRAAADAIAAVVRPDDTVARLGGDEFAVLLAGADVRRGSSVVGRILDAFARVGVAGSIGVAPYTVISGFPGAMALADAAMYEEKARRRAEAP